MEQSRALISPGPERAPPQQAGTEPRSADFVSMGPEIISSASDGFLAWPRYFTNTNKHLSAPAEFTGLN